MTKVRWDADMSGSTPDEPWLTWLPPAWSNICQRYQRSFLVVLLARIVVTIEYSSGRPFGNISLQKHFSKKMQSDPLQVLMLTLLLPHENEGYWRWVSALHLNTCHSRTLSGWTMNQSASMIDKTLQYLLAAEPFTLINLTNVVPFSPMNFIRGQSVIHIMKTHRNWSKVSRANSLPQLFYKLPQWLELPCGFMHMTSTALTAHAMKNSLKQSFLILMMNSWIVSDSTLFPSLFFFIFLHCWESMC